VAQRIVHTVNHGVLDENAMLVLCWGFTEGAQDIAKGPFAVDRHDLRTLGFERRMKADGEPDVRMDRKEFRHSLKVTGGGDRDPAQGQSQAQRIGHDGDGVGHGVHVVEWFSHTHENDVCDPLERRQIEIPEPARIGGNPAVGRDHLTDDFTGVKIAKESHPARVTEGTGLPAPDLTGHAEGDPPPFRHKDRLDHRTIFKAEKEFDRPVVSGDQGPCRFRQDCLKIRANGRAHGGRQVGRDPWIVQKGFIGSPENCGRVHHGHACTQAALLQLGSRNGIEVSHKEITDMIESGVRNLTRRGWK